MIKSPKKFIGSTCLLSLVTVSVIGLSACGSAPRTYSLTDKEFAPVRDASEVRLFLGELERPHFDLALLDSYVDQSEAPAVKRDQLSDLREKAAALGADAVVDIRALAEQHRGLVPDPAVPFNAWRQGEYELYFLRGKAVRFIDPDDEEYLEWEEQQAGLTEGTQTSAELPDPSTFDYSRIPTQRTSDPSSERRGSTRSGY
jgi:hypothetical protein